MATAERVYGRVIGAHHLSEILWGAGKRLAVVTTGKIGNARLLAGRAAELGQPVLSIWGDAVSTPAADFRGVVARLGRPPAHVFPNVAVADWAVTALLEHKPPAHRPHVAGLWPKDPAHSLSQRATVTAVPAAANARRPAAFRRGIGGW